MRNLSGVKRAWGYSLAVATLLIAGAPSPSSAAQRPVERTVRGVVESVDAKSHLMTVKLAHPSSNGSNSSSMTVAWKSRTTFEATNGAKTNAEAVKPGTAVEVRYRSLLMGANQASRISVK